MSRLEHVAVLAGLIVMIGFFVAPKSVLAHGTGYRQSDKRSISLEFSYSTGETMSYLDTKVFSPQDEKFAFQSGRTDEDGRFAFTPNVSGQWRVVVKDEEGHLAEAKIDITQDFLDASSEVDAIVEKTAVPGGMDGVVRSVLGVSLLFNIAALTSFVRRRKSSGEVN
jgi:nickel transport protein